MGFSETKLNLMQPKRQKKQIKNNIIHLTRNMEGHEKSEIRLRLALRLSKIIWYSKVK